MEEDEEEDEDEEEEEMEGGGGGGAAAAAVRLSLTFPLEQLVLAQSRSDLLHRQGAKLACSDQKVKGEEKEEEDEEGTYASIVVQVVLSNFALPNLEGL